jgi:D-alanyl-D-alanine carboxypeptidase
VALPDGSTIAVATGMADTAKKEAMTTRHLLLQGSVGKTYVSAVAMQLVHEGRFSLDDPISKYLAGEPWFNRLPNAQSITVRQLMNHTSGLERYEFNERFTADLTATPDRIWKPQELVAYILDAAAPFAAGQGWDYSDTNYIVLGMIMEKVTGRAYYDLVRDRVLWPAGLTSTVPSDSRVIRGLANGYAGANNPFGGSDAMLVDERMVINPQFEWTGGGMASTAEDLARWGSTSTMARRSIPRCSGVARRRSGPPRPEHERRTRSDHPRDAVRHAVRAQRLLPGLPGGDVVPARPESRRRVPGELERARSARARDVAGALRDRGGGYRG